MPLFRHQIDLSVGLSTALLLSMAPLLACGRQTIASAAATGAEATEELLVTRQPLVLRHLLSGEIEAENAIELSAPGGTRTQIRWLAENGTEVAAGDVVVELDNSSQTSGLEQQENAVTQAATALLSAQVEAAAQVSTARFDLFQREVDLEKAKIAADVPAELKSAREYDKLQLERSRAELELAEAGRTLEAMLRSTESDVAIAALELEKAKSKLSHTREQLDDFVLKAPRDGIVLIQESPQDGRPWQDGDTALPGWPIARLPDLQAMIVRARLFDVDDGVLEIGLSATVTLDAYPGRRFTGSVRRIEEIARQAGRRSLVRAFDVEIALDQLDPDRMRPGMSAKVVVERQIGVDEQAPVVAPRSSLDFNPREGSRARLRNGAWAQVTLGPCSHRYCVVEEGLEPGTQLAPAKRGDNR